MASREYSKRLGVLSDEQLQAALDRFGLGRLISAEPAAGGLFGQNVLLEATAGEFVFRGDPHWDPDGNDDWQFQKEQMFSRIINDARTGPPVPWPYLLEESREIFGWHWVITPRLAGASVFDLTAAGDADRRGQAAAMGTALAALHTVTLPSPATYQRETRSIEPLAMPYGAYIAGTVTRLLEASIAASSATTPEDAAWVVSVLRSAEDALALAFTPVVVHLDYSSGNVLFEQQDDRWGVSGVVDWMTAESGHPEADLCRFMGQLHFAGYDDVISEFIRAYRAVHPPLPGFEERLRAFMLWERLLIWNYGQRNRVWFTPEQTLRSWAEPYLGLPLRR